VADVLARQVDAAVGEGVKPEAVAVDPGVDFTKTPGQSVALLHGLDRVAALGLPMVLALSRKDFVGALTGRRPAGRAAGTLGAVAAVRHVPAQILRVHDVAGTRDFLTVLDAITGELAVDPDLVLREELRHEP
jgi:dihydropteroate synthase